MATVPAPRPAPQGAISHLIVTAATLDAQSASEAPRNVPASAARTAAAQNPVSSHLQAPGLLPRAVPQDTSGVYPPASAPAPPTLRALGCAPKRREMNFSRDASVGWALQAPPVRSEAVRVDAWRRLPFLYISIASAGGRNTQAIGVACPHRARGLASQSTRESDGGDRNAGVGGPGTRRRGHAVLGSSKPGSFRACEEWAMPISAACARLRTHLHIRPVTSTTSTHQNTSLFFVGT